jgi:hypothetical protein
MVPAHALIWKAIDQCILKVAPNPYILNVRLARTLWVYDQLRFTNMFWACQCTMWLAHSECEIWLNGLPYNPNLRLHATAGQLVKNGYNTGLASPLTMELWSDQPVSQQWMQYKSGQSMYNEYDKWQASPFTIGTIKWQASQFKTGDWQRLY